jgi:hypothetical protein
METKSVPVTFWVWEKFHVESTSKAIEPQQVVLDHVAVELRHRFHRVPFSLRVEEIRRVVGVVDLDRQRGQRSCDREAKK